MPFLQIMQVIDIETSKLFHTFFSFDKMAQFQQCNFPFLLHPHSRMWVIHMRHSVVLGSLYVNVSILKINVVISRVVNFPLENTFCLSVKFLTQNGFLHKSSIKRSVLIMNVLV